MPSIKAHRASRVASLLAIGAVLGLAALPAASIAKATGPRSRS